MAEKTPGGPSRRSATAQRLVDEMKQAAATAHEEKTDVLVARAGSMAAMKVVALLAMDAGECQFASDRSRRQWERATDAIYRARVAVIAAVQTEMGPAAAAILLAKVVAVICRSHRLDRAHMLRLCQHFLAPPDGPQALPLDQLLELGATFSHHDPSAPPQATESDYDDP